MTTEQAQANQQPDAKERLDALLNHIEDLMSDEEYGQAHNLLNQALKIDLFESRVYERYAFVMRMLDRPQAAELFENVVMNVNSVDAYFQVASQLLQEKLYGSAINPLRKIVELDPKVPNACFQLAYTYLKEFDLASAKENFRIAHELDPNISTAYYLGYTHLLLDDVATTRELLPFLEASVKENGEHAFMYDILREMVERYEAFPPQNLRDWHFVQYGTPLLRTSDQDLDEPSRELNGRYIFINYGFLTIARVLSTLKRMLEEVPGFPEYQYIIPASVEIAPIAFAFSKMTNIPLASTEALHSGQPGFVFCNWTGDVDRVASTVVQFPNVATFAFSLGWTMQAALCPEVVGYLDQANRLPWQETILVGENGEQQHRPAMEATPEEIGQLILDRLPEVENDKIDPLIQYYQERAHLLKVGANQNNPRLGFQIESPVQSFRMMI